MFCNIFTCFQILHKIWKFYTKFGHMILRKICKFVATGCQIVGLKYTKFNFGWGSAPNPAGRDYSAQTFQLDFRGLLLRGMDREWEVGRVRRGKWRE